MVDHRVAQVTVSKDACQVTKHPRRPHTFKNTNVQQSVVQARFRRHLDQATVQFNVADQDQDNFGLDGTAINDNRAAHAAKIASNTHSCRQISQRAQLLGRTGARFHLLGNLRVDTYAGTIEKIVLPGPADVHPVHPAIDQHARCP